MMKAARVRSVRFNSENSNNFIYLVVELYSSIHVKCARLNISLRNIRSPEAQIRPLKWCLDNNIHSVLSHSSFSSKHRPVLKIIQTNSISPRSNIPPSIWWPFPDAGHSFVWIVWVGVDVECGSTLSNCFPFFAHNIIWAMVMHSKTDLPRTHINKWRHLIWDSFLWLKLEWSREKMHSFNY